MPPPDAHDALPNDEVDAIGGKPHFDIPNLTFENRTRLAALHFDAVDQHGSAAHVIVAKTAYTIGRVDAAGLAALIPLATPAPLLTEDHYFDDDPTKGVRQESDLAPYKPRCDVIVNATAWPPHDEPTKLFSVGLGVAKLPAPTSEEATQAQGRKTMLISKTLLVHGERFYKRKWAVQRLMQWMIRIASLGLVHPVPWRLTSPAKSSNLPVRYEYGLGGECRINVGDAAAKAVPKKWRLPESAEAKANPKAHAGDAVADDFCQSNPLGRGFMRRWYLTATGITRLPAPRITYPDQTCDARQFWLGVGGKELPAPAGLGIVGRAWLPRRALAGHFDEQRKWGADEVPTLPADFDFAYWNGAPRDQQCAYLSGGEQITLVNLCRQDHTSATVNKDGCAILRFVLPQQAVVLLVVDSDGKLGALRLAIDTVVIDPDAARVELVWRASPPADGVFSQARLIHATEPEQLERLRLLEKLQQEVAATHAQAAPEAR